MLTLRKASERGESNFGWLDSRHTFSFGGYRDPAHMGFQSLRVINDDRVAPGAGFGTHAHDNMEIVSWVLSGALEHKDSLGTGSVIRPGDLQRMSAGTGVSHSEYNHSKTEPVHFLQIWFIPEKRGIAPSYEQKNFPEQDRRGGFRLLASRDGRADSVTIHQDVNMYAATLAQGDVAQHTPESGRKVWAHVATGSVALNGQTLSAGDGAAVWDEPLSFTDGRGSEVILFDLGA